MNPESTPAFSNLLILGVGLMGGSLALAAKRAGVASRVSGWSRREESLKAALEKGAIDSYSTELEAALQQADGVVIATPTQLTEDLYCQVLALVPRSTVVTDVASVKGNIQRALTQQFGDVPANVVMGHPVCGSEKSGVGAADADLYVDQRVVLIDSPQVDGHLYRKVEQLWRATGANLHVMSVEEHDRALALTSHLPHMLSFALMNQLGRSQETFDVFELSGGGFRDFTRIAASDPVMWREIALANKAELLRAIAAFGVELDELSRNLENDNGDSLASYFENSGKLRDQRLLNK